MKPVIHRTLGIGSIEVGSIGSCHFRLSVQHRADEIQIIVSGSGYYEAYRFTRLERGLRLMRHRATLDVAGVSRRYIEEIELGFDPLLRLSMHERCC